MDKIKRTAIKEDVFTVAKFMLKSGKDRKTVAYSLGISETSVERIDAAENYAMFDEQRKTRSAKIRRDKNAPEPLPEQVSIDDLLPCGDPLVRLCDAINRQTEVIERFLNAMTVRVNG